ncbi:MAG TPA: hypothetical protein VLF90_00350 [Patescibacteria group bacterium]|nr:hypothetical protein [Patescibacteria group bacterium]
MARYSADNDAKSYRGFNVGAAIFVISPEMKKSAILTDGNRKLKPQSEKICAEKSVLLQAETGGYSKAIGLVVAGASDAELIKDVTGRETPTLHPCDVCRGLLDASPIVSDDTLIITTGVDSDSHQTHSFAELQAFYEDADPSGVNEAHCHEDPGYEKWNIRKFIYGIMTGNSGIFGTFESGNRDNAEVARIALSAVLIDPSS